MIKPLPKKNVTDEVFRQMFDLIKKKKWKEGEKLPSENVLKDMFNVSRNSIRTALNRLSLLGIVETRQGEGNFVKKVGVGLYMNSLIPFIFLDVNDIFTIMEFRMGVEQQSAKLAAMRATDDEIKAIRTTFEHCLRNFEHIEHYMIVDMEFHLAISKASHNDLLYRTLSIIYNYCHTELQDFVTPSIRDKSYKFHELIVAAIEQHDPQQAMQLMNAHLEDVHTQIVEDHKRKKTDA